MSKGYKELWDVDPALFEKAQAPVVSIYLPTNRKDNLENEGEDNKERIELKDLIERARDTLEKTCEKGRDYAVVQTCVLVFVIITLVVNLLTDILYSVLDHRIKLGGDEA